MTGVLVLLRHGESTANQAGTFSGLLDVPLTRHGVQQARAAGILLREHGIFPQIAFTSTLQRAVRTAELVKSVVGRDYPTEPIWQLNERNYANGTPEVHWSQPRRAIGTPCANPNGLSRCTSKRCGWFSSGPLTRTQRGVTN